MRHFAYESDQQNRADSFMNQAISWQNECQGIECRTVDYCPTQHQPYCLVRSAGASRRDKGKLFQRIPQSCPIGFFACLSLRHSALKHEHHPYYDQPHEQGYSKQQAIPGEVQ
jgi:hypothetical protein